MIRSIESCPHFDADGAAGGPACRLVAEVLGIGPAASAAVGLDACRACCAGPTPDAGRLNPVVASLTARAAEAVEKSGGAPGCDVRHAAEVKSKVTRYLAAAGADAAKAYRPPRLTKDCHLLGEPIESPSKRACRHPDREATTPDGCLACRDWSDRPRPAPRPLPELMPAPARRGPRVANWAVGVTTSPRGMTTLDWTLDSLGRAGWEDLRIFEDLPTTIAPRHVHRPTTNRNPAIGAWPSYYLGLSELVLRHPEADAYLMVQDDVLFYDRQDLRGYIESILWPTDPPGLISLYCSAAYTRPGWGWHRLDEAWVWGALAFIFPRELARDFVSDPWVLAHRWSSTGFGLVAIDVLIGAWADRNGIPVHFPSPSLAQHVGAVSALWGSHTLDARRMADRFLADVEPD